MLSTHKGMTNDTRGTEFEYTCYTQKERVTDWNTPGWPTKDVIDRDYIVYDGKGTGRANIIAEAKTLKELKAKMGAL